MPHDWETRYREGATPWDLGEPHPELEARIAAGELELPRGVSAPRALVPGCGPGWDALALARRGWRVTAVDLVPSLAPLVEERLAPFAGRFVCADALELEDRAGFDLLWEHTFFCAIDPADRPRYGALARRVVKPGALLAALVFPVGRGPELGGPPFGMSTDELARALGPSFHLLRDEPAHHRVEGRDFGERFALFRRSA